MLDGLPLGIELASAWVRFLSCQEIVADLSQNLDILVESGTGGQQQSLHAAFDGSWELLNDETQIALCQISLFRGSFSREAANKIAKAPLSHLVRLMDSSWLRRVEENGQVRFDMLSIMRQYSSEKLDQFSELKANAENRFIQFYAAFLAQRRQKLEGGAQRKTLNEISVELENIRYAMSLAIQEEQIGPIAQSIDSLFYFHDTRSQFLAGKTLFQLMVDGVNSFPDSSHKSVVLRPSFTPVWAGFCFTKESLRAAAIFCNQVWTGCAKKM